MTNAIQHNTVFISYRRSVSRHLSRLLFKELTARGFDVFRDVDNIGAGEFGPIILGQIAARAHFVVLLAHGTLDRAIDPDDWLRREIEYAVEKQRNIIPVLVEDFRFEDGDKFMVSHELKRLKAFNAQKLIDDFWDAGFEQLVSKLTQSIDVVIESVSAKAEAKVEEIIDRNAQEPVPTQEELDIERLFAQAIFKQGQNQIESAINDFNIVLRHKPNFAEAYFQRGYARRKKEDLEGAIADYSEAIHLDPNDVGAYNNRGVARGRAGDLSGAIEDYTQAIQLDPMYSKAYSNRAEIYFAQGNLKNALEDFETAHRLKPSRPTRRAGLAITHHALGHLDDAQRFWRELLAEDEHYRDADWVQKELNWAQPLADEARKLIATL